MAKIESNLITEEELRALGRVIDLANANLQRNPDAEQLEEVELARSFHDKFQKWRGRMASQPLLKQTGFKTP